MDEHDLHDIDEAAFKRYFRQRRGRQDQREARLRRRFEQPLPSHRHRLVRPTAPRGGTSQEAHRNAETLLLAARALVLNGSVIHANLG